jgi:hypothetical protein
MMQLNLDDILSKSQKFEVKNVEIYISQDKSLMAINNGKLVQIIELESNEEIMEAIKKILENTENPDYIEPFIFYALKLTNTKHSVSIIPASAINGELIIVSETNTIRKSYKTYMVKEGNKYKVITIENHFAAEPTVNSVNDLRDAAKIFFDEALPPIDVEYFEDEKFTVKFSKPPAKAFGKNVAVKAAAKTVMEKIINELFDEYEDYGIQCHVCGRKMRSIDAAVRHIKRVHRALYDEIKEESKKIGEKIAQAYEVSSDIMVTIVDKVRGYIRDERYIGLAILVAE